jgi:hypothetical protein
VNLALIDNVYTLQYHLLVSRGIEFDWDGKNKKRLAAHGVMPAEFDAVTAFRASASNKKAFFENLR